METGARYRAPWGWVLMTVSLLSTALLVAVSAIAVRTLPSHLSAIRVLVAASPLLIVVGCLFFIVRGYVVTERELIIERPGWSTRWPLADLTAATVDPDALRRSIRLCGIGGLFVFCGWFRNKKLGTFRAFCTDPKRSVVLKFRTRVVVLTPEDPDAFVAQLARHCPTAEPPIDPGLAFR